MKIMCVNLPWSVEGKNGVRAGSRWPHIKDSPENNYLPFPFFLAYSASLLEKNGYDVSLVDALCDGKDEYAFAHVLKTYNPDMLVVETSTISRAHDLSLLSRLKRVPLVVLCGPDATMQSHEFLLEHSYVDIVCVGEYEWSLLDIAQAYEQKKPFDTIPGIIFRTQQGTICRTQDRPLGNINMLPWPKRTGLLLDRYIDAPGELPFPTLQMVASRGCPYSCAFCLWPHVMFGGKTYRVRDPLDVVNEMEATVAEYGSGSVYFDDDTFGLDAAWLETFCHILIERRQAGRCMIPWAMMTRPDCMNEKRLRLLKEAGLWAVKYGMESASQELVDAIGKNLNIKKAKEIIRLTHRLGIRTHLTFTFGLPGETKKTIKKTIRTVLQLNPFTVQFSITTPFPGTAFYIDVEKKGQLLSKEWQQYDGNAHSVIRTETLSSDELVASRQEAYRIWNRHVRMRRWMRLLFPWKRM